jgi:hypothetical protein
MLKSHGRRHGEQRTAIKKAGESGSGKLFLVC